MLAAFGLGWALIAVLTVRFTNRPQRWAFVPASAMGATGITLLVASPENDVMTRLSWVWPPAVLAMAVWMFVQTRRCLQGRGRWLLSPVIAVLALASVGATYENIALANDRNSYAAPGQLFEIGGHRLHLDCRGQGSPTVVLFNGLGEISASWARIVGPVAENTRVCAYDRAGQGWSSDARHPQDGIEAATDLHALLAAAGEPGPYVLVGHSTGGTYAMTYASRYHEQVAGLVLLDSSSPEQLTRIPSYAAQYAVMRRGIALLPTANRLGVGRLFAAPHLPEPAADQVRALTSTARAASNGRDELSVVLDVFEQAQALTTLGDRPLAVLTASDSVANDGWTGAQDRLAALSTNHVHRVISSSHAGLLEDAGPAAESVRAISEVISSVRTGASLDTP
jgi:pimeloyl-ACP methyl ester carboxylesterase